MFKLCFDFVRNKKTIKATYYNTAWHGGCFLQLICFFQLSAWINEKKLWLHWTVYYSFDIQMHILYFDSRIKRLMILWKIAYALFAILDWYSPGLQCISLWSMIKLKAFFLGHWSIAISYRCRLDRTFIYNTRTQLKAQKSIMEMFYFFRNILRYATLEIFNLWMNDGNKTTFLRQIKFTGIFKWANAITMKIQIHLNILSLNESYLKRQCLST